MPRAGVAAWVALIVAVLEPRPAGAEKRAITIRIEPGLACPDQTELRAALGRLGRRVDESHGVERAAPPVSLAVEQQPDSLRIVLSTRRAVLLDRTLPAAECAALTEAIALVVDRRLAGVEWSGAVTSPPGPMATSSVRARAQSEPVVDNPGARPLRLDLALVAARSFEHAGLSPGLLGGARLTLRGPFALGAAVGWIFHGSFAAGPGSTSVEEVPVHAGALALWRVGPRLELGVEARARLGLLRVRGHGLDTNESTVGASLRAGPSAWAGVRIMDRLWIASSVAALWLAFGHDIVVEGLGPVARESVLSVEWTLGLGYATL